MVSQASVLLVSASERRLARAAAFLTLAGSNALDRAVAETASHVPAIAGGTQYEVALRRVGRQNLSLKHRAVMGGSRFARIVAHEVGVRTPVSYRRASLMLLLMVGVGSFHRGRIASGGTRRRPASISPLVHDMSTASAIAMTVATMPTKMRRTF